jgi:hypothetical protein
MIRLCSSRGSVGERREGKGKRSLLLILREKNRMGDDKKGPSIKIIK